VLLYACKPICTLNHFLHLKLVGSKWPFKEFPQVIDGGSPGRNLCCMFRIVPLNFCWGWNSGFSVGFQQIFCLIVACLDVGKVNWEHYLDHFLNPSQTAVTNLASHLTITVCREDDSYLPIAPQFSSKNPVWNSCMVHKRRSTWCIYWSLHEPFS